MDDRHLPVSGKTSDGHAVSITEKKIGFLTQIAGWGSFEEAAQTALCSWQIDVPMTYDRAEKNGEVSVWRIAPDRILVETPAPPADLTTEDIVQLDLTDARTRIELKGPGAEELLAKVSALDFSERRFAVGTFAQTGIHHVAVLIERVGSDLFTVLIPTTWVVSIMSYIGNFVMTE